MPTPSLQTDVSGKPSKDTTPVVSNLYGIGQIADRSSKEDIAIAVSDTVKAYDEFKELKRKQLELFVENAKINLELDNYLKAHQKEEAPSAPFTGETILEKTAVTLGQITGAAKDALNRNYFKDSEEEVLRHRASIADIEAGAVARRLETFNFEYLKGNTVALRALNENSVSLATTLARGDLGVMLNSLADSLDIEELNQIYSLVNKSKEVGISDEIRTDLLEQTLTKVTSYLENHKSILEKDERVDEINELLRLNDLDQVIKLSDEYFSELSGTESFNKSVERLKIPVESFASLPSESLSEIGIKTSAPSNLLDDAADRLSRLDIQDLQHLTPREARIALETKNRLWDNTLPWKSDMLGQSDLKVLSTSYATLKRISELTSAVDTALLSVSNQTISQEEMLQSRKDVADKFWDRYFETKSFVKEEMNNEILRTLNYNADLTNITDNQTKREVVILAALRESLQSPPNLEAKRLASSLLASVIDGKYQISNDVFNLVRHSLDSESRPSELPHVNQLLASRNFNVLLSAKLISDLDNLTSPYQVLINALESVNPETVSTLYDQQTLSSHEETFKKTILAINPAFQNIGISIKNSFGQFVKTVEEQEPNNQSNHKIRDLVDSGRVPEAILESIRSMNLTHPEYSNLKLWIDSFPKRFAKVIR